jgi:hypothetical protein
MKGAQTAPWVNAPCLDNVRVTVKAAYYSPSVSDVFNVGKTLPATGVGKYVSHLYSMLASPMSRAFVRHRPVAYARGV